MSKVIRSVIFTTGGFFFIIDRLLKYLSFTYWSEPFLINSYIGWLPYGNRGIAFGIIIPNYIVIVLTLFLLLVLFYYFLSTNIILLQQGLLLIFIGAISNLIDRLWFNYTLDYFLVYTSIFNIADILIIIGAIMVFFANKKTGKFFSKN